MAMCKDLHASCRMISNRTICLARDETKLYPDANNWFYLFYSEALTKVNNLSSTELFVLLVFT